MPPEVQSAGATPAAEGATPSQNQPAQPAAGQQPEGSQQPATGGEDQLGEAGKRALDRMKAERDSADKERKALAARVEELENASKSDQEKAVAAARKEGETASTDRWVPIVRSLRIEGALRDAGCTKPTLAARSPEFETLKVGDDGSVDGLDKAIETFKEANADLFPPTKPTGSADGGARGTPAGPDLSPGLDRLRHAYAEIDGQRTRRTS